MTKKNERSQKPPVLVTQDEVIQLLCLGYLCFEKCELKEAHETFTQAHSLSRRSGWPDLAAEALMGLLRFASEALDDRLIETLEAELDTLIKKSQGELTPRVWYCKATIAGHRNDWKSAQRLFHRFLRSIRQAQLDPQYQAQYQARKLEGKKLRAPFESLELLEARALTMLANVLVKRGKLRRTEWLSHEILKRYEKRGFRAVNGLAYLLLAVVAERRKDYPTALMWCRKAHVTFLAEHNWYYYLYVLYGYARISRLQHNYAQAYWYLDLLDKAVHGAEFGVMRREIERERSRLEDDALDLLIDTSKGVVKTKDGKPISLRKQFILLDILRALSSAHSRPGIEAERGLSKSEIIEKVWKESYRPEAHDNKLYYNINRLRKLIEPDVSHPKYLLSWKEGYRLAPGLKIHLVEGGAEIRGKT